MPTLMGVVATENATMIDLGSKVYLRACRVGEPGTVIRSERGKLTVYWADMDFWSKHRPEALEIARQGITDAKQT